MLRPTSSRLGIDHLDAGEEGLAVEAVVVDPEGVGTGFGGERPVDRSLAPALAVAGEVVFEELVGIVEVVAKGIEVFLGLGFDLEDLAGLLPRWRRPAVAPDDGEGVADAGDDVLGVAVRHRRGCRAR